MSQKSLAIFAVFLLMTGMFLVSAEAPIGNDAESQNEIQISTENSNPITYIKGDLTHDGKLTPDDLKILIDHLYENLNPLPNSVDYQIADMDNDNNLDISDITLLVQKLIDLGYFKDTKAPEIKLVSPDDNDDFATTKSFKTINFRYQVTDESNIASCKLIIDGDVEETDNSVEKDITNTFSVDIDKGNHDWKISCKDIKGNEGFSSIRDFDINKEPTSTDNTFKPIYNPVKKETTTDFVIPQDNTITLNPKSEQSKFEFNWVYIALGFLVAIIVVMISMIFVIRSRK
jgi:hypothetical protein